LRRGESRFLIGTFVAVRTFHGELLRGTCCLRVGRGRVEIHRQRRISVSMELGSNELTEGCSERYHPLLCALGPVGTR